MTEFQKNKLAVLNGEEQIKERTHEIVREKVGARYSIFDEIAILRQRDTKPAEFAEYNAFVEQCKAEAKAEMEETR